MFLILIPFISTLAWRWRKAEPAIARAASLASRSARIPTYRQMLPELARELARAKRYQHPLAVLVMGLRSNQLPEQLASLLEEGGNGSAASRMQFLARTAQLVSLALGSILRDALRESDVVSYVATEDQYVMLLTESNKSQAGGAVRRLDELFYKRTFAHLQAGVTEFPTDGLTLEDLIRGAQTAWHQHLADESSLGSRVGRGDGQLEQELQGTAAVPSAKSLAPPQDEL